MDDVRNGAVPLRVRDLFSTRAVGVAAVCVVAAVVAWRLPPALRDVDAQVEQLAAMPAGQRELLGARTADVDTRVFVEARRRIQPDETYAVVTGPNVAVSTPSTRFAVAPFARFYLLPRRQLPEPAGADWIVSFGADLESLGLPLGERHAIAPGIELARVAR
jgi:hypothetical protein